MSTDTPATLATLLGPHMAMCEIRGGGIEGELFDAEFQYVARAIPRRIEEFRMGRAAARNALAQLGFEPVAIGIAESRAPLWPEGAVGSISHCDGFCGAVVALESHYRAVGIDVSENSRLFEGAIDAIASAGEKKWVESTTTEELATDALLFSLKETVFKLWSPITHTWLGFEEAEITVDLGAGRFSAEIMSGDTDAAAKFPAIVEGRFTHDDSFILSQSYLKQ